MAAVQASSGEPLRTLAGAAVLETLPGGARADVLELRRKALERALALGLPSPKAEGWKYTNLGRALRSFSFLPSDGQRAAVSLDYVPSLLPDTSESLRLVFLNGFFREERSLAEGLPAGVRLKPLGKVLESEPDLLEPFEREWLERGESEGLAALNRGLGEDGLLLALDPGVTVEQPIEVIFLGSLAERPIAYHPRLLVALGAGARATLVEHHHGLGTEPYLANHVSQILLDRGASLTHLSLQEETRHAFHLQNSQVRLAAGALYDGFAVTIGAGLSRREMHVELEGEEAEARLKGAYLLSDGQHGDTTCVVEHRAPRTVSRETYRGVLDGRARAVFQGRITVRPGAQKSDGRMLNRTLLLSEGAEIDSKPELEIYADDVQCAHGATAGELDPEALFYLRSRGLDERRARRLLVEGFLAEAAESLPEGPLRQAVRERFSAWLAAL